MKKKNTVNMFHSIYMKIIGKLLPLIKKHLILLEKREEKIANYFSSLNRENYD